jgi:predicted nuclease of predicted toxin-antitoxin system
LFDNGLSPRLSELLRDRGHDGLHVRDLGLSAASDAEILQTALELNRIVVAYDKDFGALLAHSGAPGPSVLRFQHGPGLTLPAVQAELIARAVLEVGAQLRAGAIAVLQPDGTVRVRPLPVKR